MALHQASPTCPALFIAAPASGQGKTTVTAAQGAALVCPQRAGKTNDT